MLVGVAQGSCHHGARMFRLVGVRLARKQARADEGPLRLSMYLAMGGYFVVALTIPEAFNDLPGRLARVRGLRGRLRRDPAGAPGDLLGRRRRGCRVAPHDPTG